MDPEDDDPVVASYDVLLNPTLPPGQHLYILQHFGRSRADPNHVTTSRPSEVRLKPQSGMMELDFPLDTTVAYDQTKGLKWGRVLKEAMDAKGGGSFGLAGGFGVGTAPPRPKKRNIVTAPNGEEYEEEQEEELLSFKEAAERGLVLSVRTVGGLVTKPKYQNHMIGVFDQGKLHLTPADALVNLRPQLHHIDAMAQSEQAASRAGQVPKDGAAAASAGQMGGASAAGAGGAGVARAIHMTVKGAGGDDALTTDTMADRLRAVQQEPWRRLDVADDTHPDAWAAFQESLLFGSGAADAEEAEGKGKETKPETPRLETSWGDRELFDAISGVKRTTISDNKTNGKDNKKKKKDIAPAAAVKTQADSSPESKRGRPKGKAPAVAAPKRQAKGKGVAFDLTGN